VGQEYRCSYLRTYLFVGVVAETNPDGTFTVAVRNKISKGDVIELMGPGMRNDTFTASLIDEKGNPLDVANPNQRIRMTLPEGAAVHDLLRVSR